MILHFRRKLQCFFSDHDLTFYPRNGNPQTGCSRCGEPYAYTLKERLKQLGDRWRRRQENPSKPSDNSGYDDIPF